MTSNHIAAPKIAEPTELVVELALALERVAVLLARTNSDLMKDVVSGLPRELQAVHHSAYTVWCSNQIAVEKLEEIHKLLADAGDELHAHPQRRNGGPGQQADATEARHAEWTEALSAWAAARSVVARQDATPGGVPDEQMDKATGAEHEAAERLAALPAPDRAAVGIKINALLDSFGGPIDVPTLRMIAADAVRGEEA
ncbi:hypothetical protein CA236_00185 [Sphingomonas sp. ABOLG]|uniref:hypothetical protein n=1 Tax=Sphingomonas sp. ABOLG TaxID=1985880 RepID=UPI000F7E93D0|nr:hypothetical protein [Sphingomonas sp. ABOLG]RSV20372.1 hypothetical protein CA236_00185 [Sphingomonas sp. ABOLG]